MDKFETWWEREVQEFLYELNTTTDDDIKLVAEIAWKNGAYCAEQAEHEPAPWKHDCAALCMNDVELWIDNCPHCGKPRTAPSEPVKQEPVGKGCRYNGGTCTRKGCVSRCQAEQLCVENNDLKFKVEELEAITTEPVKQEPVGVVETSNEWGVAGVVVAGTPVGTKLYTHPVRTKDLTDCEIGSIYEKHHALGGCWTDGFAYERAVIAADRRKNK